MGSFVEGSERRQCARLPFSSPIHLMADSGQLLIGNAVDIGTNGLRVQSLTGFRVNTFVMFKLYHEKSSIGGYGRVVWSESNQRGHFCGIKFLKMKQKDKQGLDGVLERPEGPICPVCRSRIDVDMLRPYFEKRIQERDMDLGDSSPLMEVAYLLNSTLSWSDLAEKILEVVKHCFKAEGVRLAVFDKNTGTLEVSHHVGTELPYDFEKSLMEEKHYEPPGIFVREIPGNPSLSPRDVTLTAERCSVVVIPLLEEGRALGILSLYTTQDDQGEALKKGKKKLLSTFANLIAIGIKTRSWKP